MHPFHRPSESLYAMDESLYSFIIEITKQTLALDYTFFAILAFLSYDTGIYSHMLLAAHTLTYDQHFFLMMR